MRLDDKRKVIEVLLCCGDPEELESIGDMLFTRGECDIFESSLFEDASNARKQVARERCGDCGMSVSEDYYEDDCLEAAYRLIESSPTLRAEWFGAP